MVGERVRDRGWPRSASGERRTGAGFLAGCILAAILLLVAVAAPAAAAPLRVVATIAHLGEPLSRIAGDRAQVESLLGEGIDPHLYRLSRSDVARLTGADVIFWNGLHLEAQMAEMLERLGRTKPVVAVGDRLDADGLLTDAEGARDPHIWMDPGLWRAALAVAVDTLVAADPEGAATYRAAAERYFAELDGVVRYADRVLATVPAESRMLVTAHDAFGYFGRRFGLEVRAIQGISTESEAGLKAIEDLIETLVERRIGAVFVESSVSDRGIRALIEGAASRGQQVRIGGRLYSDAMGEHGTYEGTYIGMLDHNVTVIAQALGGNPPAGGMLGRLAFETSQ